MLVGLCAALVASGCPSEGAELPTTGGSAPADEGTTGGTGPGITVDSLVTGIDSAASTDSDGSGGGGGSEESGRTDATDTDTDPGATSNTEDTDGTDGTDDTGTTGEPRPDLPPYCDSMIPEAGAEPLIDDLELELGQIFPDEAIPEVDGRVGFWFTYNDESPMGMQTPAPGSFQPTEMGATGTEFSARTFGDGFDSWGAGMAVVLNNDFDGNCPYDASSYDGVTFYARGMGQIRFMITTRATTELKAGGTCDPSMGQCADHHGVFIDLVDSWTEYTFTWEELTQLGWGIEAEFNPRRIMEFNWQTVVDEPFDFSVDELAFHAAP
ncbi:MAG: hypothetical protein AAF799_16545 [Myxococcota bacterium]